MFTGSIWLLLLSVSVFALNDDIAQAVDKTNQSATASQHKIDKVYDESDKAYQEYKGVLLEISNMQRYVKELENLTQAQDQEKTSIKLQIKEVQELHQKILPLITQMIDTYAQFVNIDTLFYNKSESKELYFCRK